MYYISTNTDIIGQVYELNPYYTYTGDLYHDGHITWYFIKNKSQVAVTNTHPNYFLDDHDHVLSNN